MTARRLVADDFRVGFIEDEGLEALAGVGDANDVGMVHLVARHDRQASRVSSNTDTQSP